MSDKNQTCPHCGGDPSIAKGAEAIGTKGCICGAVALPKVAVGLLVQTGQCVVVPSTSPYPLAEGGAFGYEADAEDLQELRAAEQKYQEALDLGLAEEGAKSLGLCQSNGRCEPSVGRAELAKVRSLLAFVTPGPWVEDSHWLIGPEGTVADVPRKEDRDFIIAARSSLPWLMEEIVRLRRACDRTLAGEAPYPHDMERRLLAQTDQTVAAVVERDVAIARAETAERKAAQYEQDWIAAKHEWAGEMGTVVRERREALQQRDSAIACVAAVEREHAETRKALDTERYVGEHALRRAMEIERERDAARALLAGIEDDTECLADRDAARAERDAAREEIARLRSVQADLLRCPERAMEVTRERDAAREREAVCKEECSNVLADLEVARLRLTQVGSERDIARIEQKRYWHDLCAVVEALGQIAPEAAPYAAGWAKKVREERDALRRVVLDVEDGNTVRVDHREDGGELCWEVDHGGRIGSSPHLSGAYRHVGDEDAACAIERVGRG